MNTKESHEEYLILTGPYEIVPSQQSMNADRFDGITSGSEFHLLSPESRNTPYQPSTSFKTPDQHSGDDNNLSMLLPRVSSNTKIKLQKCKKCEFTSNTKNELWEHARVHIKPEELLVCDICPFVTKYRHHLQCHKRRHIGWKPFQCNQCSYSCITKSMLTAHLKSHSNIRPYRCADCIYAAKTFRPLRSHLLKFNHKPGMILNLDGTPNPFLTVNVNGIQRGSKRKPISATEVPQTSTITTSQISLETRLPLSDNFIPGLQSFSVPSLLNFETSRTAYNSPEHGLKEKQTYLACESLTATSDKDMFQILNLSKFYSKPAEETPQNNRRKGYPLKLMDLPTNSSYEEPYFSSRIKSPVKQSENRSLEAVGNNNNKDDKSDLETFCQYCNITFGDAILHIIHMAYHNINDPFTCNSCGEQCEDKVDFHLHIIRKAHSFF